MAGWYLTTHEDEEGEICASIQGACFDGKYVFYSFVVYDRYKTYNATTNKNENKADEIGVGIISGKFNEDGVFVTQTVRADNSHGNEALGLLCHANDLTYNNLTQKIVATCCSGNHQYICTVDAEYFRTDIINYSLDGDEIIVNQYPITCQATNIAYDETNNEYIIGIKGQFHCYAILDSDFNLVGLIKSSSDNYNGDKDLNDENLSAEVNLENKLGLQSLACDDNYIYAAYYISDTANDVDANIQNVLVISDRLGNVKKEINLSIERNVYNGSPVSYEIEGITMHNDRFLLTFLAYYREKTGINRRPRYYYYDLSEDLSEIYNGGVSAYTFNIEYRPDFDNLNENKRMQNVFYGIPTKTLKNTFIKSNQEFVGWNLYYVEGNKWYCEEVEEPVNGDSKDKKWFTTVPDGYKKCIYSECQAVANTVPAGDHVILSAVWKNADGFSVSFNSNGGTGVMENNVVINSESSNLPTNIFTKSGRIFQAWNPYCVETGMWLYENADGYQNWYKEDSQPSGYKKAKIADQSNISNLVSYGSHIVMFALWDEFVIHYNANGKRVYANYVVDFVSKKLKVGDSNNEFAQFTSNKIHEGVNSNGYYAHRIDIDKWRFTVGDSASWLDKTSALESGYTYFLYKITNSKPIQTAPAGERVVFMLFGKRRGRL